MISPFFQVLLCSDRFNIDLFWRGLMSKCKTQDSRFCRETGKMVALAQANSRKM